MANRADDEVDIACREWARARRAQLGLDDPRMERAAAKDFIGAVKSTLGSRRDLHAGSSSEGRVEQHFPEGYYSGTALQVHQAYKRMAPRLRAILDIQYIARAPATAKADLMAMDVVTYYRHLNHAKGIVLGWLMRCDQFDNYGTG